MTKTVAQRLREAAAHGMDISGIHCDLELEAADEIERLSERLQATELHVAQLQRTIERRADEPTPTRVQCPDPMGIGCTRIMELKCDYCDQG